MLKMGLWEFCNSIGLSNDKDLEFSFYFFYVLVLVYLIKLYIVFFVVS